MKESRTVIKLGIPLAVAFCCCQSDHGGYSRPVGSGGVLGQCHSPPFHSAHTALVASSCMGGWERTVNQMLIMMVLYERVC